MAGGGLYHKELTLVGASQEVDLRAGLGEAAGRVLIVNGGATPVVLEGFGDNITVAANRSLEFSGSYNVVRLNGTGTVDVFAHIDADAKVEYEAYTALAEKKGLEYLEVAFTHDDFTAAATSESVNIPGLPANTMIFGAEINLTETFDDGGIMLAIIAQVGVSGDEDAYVDDVDVHDGTASLGRENNNTGTNFPYVNAGITPVLTIVATGGNVSTLAQGKLAVRIFYREI